MQVPLYVVQMHVLSFGAPGSVQRYSKQELVQTGPNGSCNSQYQECAPACLSFSAAKVPGSFRPALLDDLIATR